MKTELVTGFPSEERVGAVNTAMLRNQRIKEVNPKVHLIVESNPIELACAAWFSTR
jgi:hypothetical protein